MSLLNKITKKISGVEQSRDASEDSEVRQLLYQYADYEEDVVIQNRYTECGGCPSLKEEFKLLGATVKDQTPACGECGCNLIIKIPMESMECPLGKW